MVLRFHIRSAGIDHFNHGFHEFLSPNTDVYIGKLKHYRGEGCRDRNIENVTLQLCIVGKFYIRHRKKSLNRYFFMADIKIN